MRRYLFKKNEKSKILSTIFRSASRTAMINRLKKNASSRWILENVVGTINCWLHALLSSKDSSTGLTAGGLIGRSLPTRVSFCRLQIKHHRPAEIRSH